MVYRRRIETARRQQKVSVRRGELAQVATPFNARAGHAMLQGQGPREVQRRQAGQVVFSGLVHAGDREWWRTA